MALAELAPKFATLVRSVGDPSAHAIGHWSVGEVAAHVSHVATFEVAAVTGTGRSVMRSMGVPQPKDISEVAAMNQAVLEHDPVRDPDVLAGRIEESAAELLHLTDGEERVITWLLGARLPLSAVCSHFISELVLHGRDIAHGAKLRWRIDPLDARISIEGFYLPVIAELGGMSVSPGDGKRTTSCEIRLRRGGRWVFAGSESGLAVLPSGPKVDLHISADPVEMLLVMSGRSGRLGPTLRGRMFAWGRHPLRAMRMLAELRGP
jgi:hypothetical protein